MKKIFILFIMVVGVIVYYSLSKNINNSRSTSSTEKIYSQRKGYVKGKLKQDSPNLFAEYFKEIKTEIGSDEIKYPNNYLSKELRKALINKPLSKKLDNIWVSRGPGNVGGRARGIIIDPDDATASTWFIAAVGGGVWKTTNAGATWNELTSEKGSLSASYMAMASSNHDVIYLGTGEGFGNLDALGGQGIWKSTDKGDNWTQLSRTVNRDFGIINRIIVDPDNANILLACTTIGYGDRSGTNSPGIWKSIDGGVSWAKKYSNNNRIHQIIYHPNDFSVQYASVYGKGVFKSTDEGENWSLVSSATIEGRRIELAISPTDPKRLFASVQPIYSDPPKPSEMYVSSDSGTTWIKLTISKDLLGGQGWYDNAIIVSPYDKDVVFVAGVNIYKIKYNVGSLARVETLTDNYGSNPALHKGTHVDNHFFAVAKLDEATKTYRLLGTNDGGVCYTDNEGSTFKQPNTGFITSQFYGVDKANGSDLYIGGMQDNSCYVSPENPTSSTDWSFIFGGDGFDVVWSYEDENKVMFTSQYNNIAITHTGIDDLYNSGWLASVDRGDGNNAPFFTKLAQSKYYSDLVFTYGKSGVWRTENFGINWEIIKMPTDYKGLSSTTEIKVSLAAPEIVWTGGSLMFDNPMYVSSDFGKSFTQVSFSSMAKSSLSGFTTHPIEKNTAYALFSTYSNPKILKTTDLGATWTDISGFNNGGGVSSNGFPDVAVFDLLVMPYNTKIIWAGTEIGLFESIDGGNSWHFANNNLPPVSIYDLLIVNDEVVIGTHGRGVWTVAIQELKGLELPLADAPAKLDVSYIFDGTSQKADIDLKYRSNYQSVKVFVNDVIITEFTNVSVGDVENIKANIVGGENIIKIISDVGGRLLETKTTIEALPLKAPSSTFVSDFNNMNSISDEFYGSGFSISQPSGFDNKAINTSHPYAVDKTLYLYLNTPIIVNKDYPDFIYKDVALIEPGEPGTVYPHEEFWDYVVVQTSINGIDWSDIGTPYDASLDSEWLTKYNSSTNPSKTDYKQHAFKTSDFYNDGDVVLVRFKLYSDAAATGWGWIIDNLEIQKDALSIEDNFLASQFKIYPNPVVDGVLYLESTTDSKILNIELYNLTGQVLLNKNFANVEKAKLDISNFAKGQYLIKVETDKGAFSKKIMVK